MTLHNFSSTLDSALPLVFPMLIWATLVCFFVALLFAFDDGVKRLRRLHQIPCDRCIYNTGNPYLRCPVNPLSAFSEDAICCSDFESTKGRLLCHPPKRFAQGLSLSYPWLTFFKGCRFKRQ